MIQFRKAAVNILLLSFFTHISLAELPKNLDGKAKLIILFVIDGLRPDLITEDLTPNLYKLKMEGVFFENSHAVFPTVTRVNSAAIATASYPIHSGIVSNSIFIPEINATSSFSTGEYQNLLKLDSLTDGKLLLSKSWAQRLVENGLKPAAIGSGSTGSSFLLNPHAVQGTGILINGWMEPDSIVAYPSSVNGRILRKIGTAPNVDQDPNYNEKVNWTTKVFTEYLLEEHKPDVIYCWVTEPDHTQHSAGIGAPETMETIRNTDRNIGLIMQKLQGQGLYAETDIFVTSDHGFSTRNYSVNVEGELIKAGLKKSHDSGDVVLASSGQTVLIHIKDHNKDQIEDIVNYFQHQDWVDVIFTKGTGAAPQNFKGWVDGTFSLELIHLPSSGRGPDILITFPWSSQRNKYGYQGKDYSNGGGTTGPRDDGAGHGSMSPWTVRNTMIAWGVDFKSGKKSRVPAANLDFTATILALKNIPFDDEIQGRVLYEALKDGEDIEKISTETKLLTIQNGKKQSTVQISTVGENWYIDKSWSLQADE